MRTSKIIILCLVLFISYCNTQAKEPIPQWAINEPIAPSNVNYVYVSGVGIGYNEAEAVDKARNNALKNAMSRSGLIDFTRQSTSQGMLDGEIITNRIARNIKCQTLAIPAENGQVKVYVLLQVQKNAGETVDFSEPRFVDCRNDEFEHDLKAWIYGEYPFSSRVFVPGWAQIHKGSTGKGIFFIAGETVLLGGVVIAESLQASNEAKISSTHRDKQMYIDNADMCENVRNGLIAGAVALYVWNVIDGIAAKGKKANSTAVHIMPYVVPDVGSGVTLSLNF